MPKYILTMRHSNYLTLEIEANTKEEAIEAGYNEDYDRWEYDCCCWDAEIIDAEEVTK